MTAVADPVVDPRILAALADELEDRAAAVGIAPALPREPRAAGGRLDAACSQEDLETAMDVVLSLKVTSATVGATVMRWSAPSASSSPLTAGDWAAARSAADAVRAATPPTLGAFDSLLG